jgi:hypothetical protein
MPGDEYVVLVQFLLDMGADPNVLRAPTHDDSLQYQGDCQGTTCDQLAEPIALGLSSHFPESPQLLDIFERITDAGGHSTRPYVRNIVPSFRCLHFPLEIEHLKIFEDQIDSKFPLNIPVSIKPLMCSSFGSWGSCAANLATK